MQQTLASIGINIDWSFSLTVGGLIMTRLVLMVATMPFLVGKPVPAQVKMGLILALLLFLYPYLAPENKAALPREPLTLFMLFLKEAGIGLTIGMAAAIVFHGFQAAGSVVDNQRGAAQARLLIPSLGEQASIFGNFEYQLGLVVFLCLDGHVMFLKAIIDSYDYLPLLSFPAGRTDMIDMVGFFIQLTGQVLLLSVQLAAPVLISIFIADMVLGIVSKTAPSVNVWELSFAVKGVVGVLVVFLSIGLIVTQMEKLSLGMVTDVTRLLRLIATP